MKVIWSPLSLQRVDEIVDYIAKDDPAAARRWAGALVERVQQLEDYPERGRTVPELFRPDVRELLYGEYRIIYRLDTSAVEILTVRHGRRRFEVSERRVR